MSRPETPLLTADIVIQLQDRPGTPIVLIERANPPRGWALPGGFVDVGETVAAAARREAVEETGLVVRLVALLGCYSDPHRDRRGHTASLVYVANATGTPRADDDAAGVAVFDPDQLPSLVFDHNRILADYRRWRTQGRLPPPE